MCVHVKERAGFVYQQRSGASSGGLMLAWLGKFNRIINRSYCTVLERCTGDMSEVVLFVTLKDTTKITSTLKAVVSRQSLRGLLCWPKNI